MGTLVDAEQKDFAGDTVTAVNLTAHLVTNFVADGSSTVYLTNCLFVCSSNWNSLFLYTNACAFLDSDSGIFQTVGGAGHYLADSSPYRGSGVAATNLDSVLLADLAQRTTYPPLVFSNATISADTNFAPRVTRGAPVQSLGYHYESLDYCFGGATANANLTFTAGTAVGWFHASSGWYHAGHGIHTADGKTITFSGTVEAPCYWVRCSTVQEGVNGLWQGGYGPGGITGWASSAATAPQIQARFLRASVLAGDNLHFRDDNGWQCVRATHCEFSGSGIAGYASSFYLTNCLFNRGSVWLAAGQVDIAWDIRNCTFVAGDFTISRYEHPNPVSVHDCVFDQTAISTADQYAGNTNYTFYNYNAFLVNSNRTYPTGAADQVVSNFNWQTSWLGKYYLPSNSPLINTGSVAATTVGLANFTTQTNQAQEDASTVDLGYHFTALPLPLISVQPSSQTVTQHSAAVFTVIVTNTALLRYQWTFNDTPIPGASNSSFTQTDAHLANAGNYAVIVSNPAGSTTSSNALLTVLAPPTITLSPTNQIVLQYSDFTFRAAAEGSLPIAYQWTYNGQNIRRAYAKAYTKTRAQLTDAGSYAVVVSNAYGQVTSSVAALQVVVPVSISVQPTNRTICAGNSTTFHVAASGTTPLTYQWLKDREVISGATFPSHTRNNLSSADTGWYSVVVSNIAGPLESQGAYLFVGHGIPRVELSTVATNSALFNLQISSAQADHFTNTVNHQIFANPTNLTIEAPYAAAFAGRMAGSCGNSMSIGINVSKLPSPQLIFSTTNLDSPGSVTIVPGSENLTNLVEGLFPTELGRTPDSQGLSTNVTWAMSLRANGATDDAIRAVVINRLRASNEYKYTNSFGTSPSYVTNENYLIEYSLDQGASWSAYSGAIPVSDTINVLARVGKLGTTDRRTLYAYVTSDPAQASFTYLPASWLSYYFGPGYATNPAAAWDADPNTNGCNNLHEYKYSGNPTNVLTTPTNPGYFVADSAEDVISVRFSTNLAVIAGPAAAGFDANDAWNLFSPDVEPPTWLTAFRQGVPLTTASGSASGVKLWAFVGPFRPDWFHGVPHCHDQLGNDESSWVQAWDCWWHAIYPCYSGSSYSQNSMNSMNGLSLAAAAAPGGFCIGRWWCDGWASPCFPWYTSDYWYRLYGYFPYPDWWHNWWRLRWRIGSPLSRHTWLPAFDRGYGTASLPLESTATMANDGLTSMAQDEMTPWLRFMRIRPAGCHSNTPVYLFLTGLPLGHYSLYLYGATQAKINGQPTDLTFWRGTNEAFSLPAATCTTHPARPGQDPIYFEPSPSTNQTPSLGTPRTFGWTNEPVWLDKTNNRIEILFEETAYWLEGFRQLRHPATRLAGLQLVRLHPAVAGSTNVYLAQPAPSAMPGRLEVKLSWPDVRLASGYRIYRSITTTDNFQLLDTTRIRFYTDTHLSPDTTYYYYVVATNSSTISAASSPPVAARTFSAAPQTPASIYPPVGGEGSGGIGGIPGSGVILGTNVVSVWSNSPPELSRINPLKIRPRDNSFTIPFLKLIAASDAWDPDDDAIAFQVRKVLNGSLSIDLKPFDPITNCIFDNQSLVLWSNAYVMPEAPIEVFTVAAFDGSLSSSTAVPVTFLPLPRTYLLGWGQDRRGSLGNGYMGTNFFDGAYYDTGLIRTHPTRVANISDVLRVSADGDALGAAVCADGSLWMWGYDYGLGVFGEGQPSCYDPNPHPYHDDIRPTPFKVRMTPTNGTVLADFTNVVDISVRSWHSAIALRSDGTLWSWGVSSDGALGREVPQSEIISNTAGWMDATKKARPITGFKNDAGEDLAVVQFVRGGCSCLALCADGSVWWWGQANLSYPTPNDPFATISCNLAGNDGVQITPARLRKFDYGSRVIQVAGDGLHFAVLKQDGTVWEFGLVPRLSFYDSDPTCYSCGLAKYYQAEPLQVTNLPPNIRSVCTDSDYALALTDDGYVYAWGTLGDTWYNDSSQIFASPNPVRIEGLGNIASIDLCSQTALAMDNDGLVYAWGRNCHGHLGTAPDLAAPFDLTPAVIAGLGNASAAVLGGITAFAIATLDHDRPTGLTATARDQSVELHWDPFPLASSYLVERALTNADVLFATVGPALTNTFLDTSLDNGTYYFYRVRAILDGTSNSAPSGVAAAMPLAPPTQPVWHEVTDGQTTNLAIYGTCRSIRLAWDPVTNAFLYRLSRAIATNLTEWTLVAQVGSTNYVDRTAQSGIDYTYQLVAFNTAGQSPPSALALARVNSDACPTPPVITALSVPQDGYLTICWTQATPTAGSLLPDNYRIQWHFHAPSSPHHGRLTDTCSFRWQDIPVGNISLNDGIFSYTLGPNDSLGPDLTLWCKVSGVANGEPGDPSNLAGPVSLYQEQTTYSAPSDLFAVPGCRQIYLEWTASDMAAYCEVQYRTNGGATTWLTLDDHLYDNRFWHTNLAPGTTNEYQVRYYVPVYDIINGYFDPNVIVYYPSPFATVTNGPADCAPPTNHFTVCAEGYDGMVAIHWESLTNQPPLLCYLERKFASENDTAYSILTETGYGLAYIDRDVINGTSYSYRVTAFDTNYHRFRASTNATPQATNTLQVVASPGNAHVTLTWSTNFLTAGYYEIKRATQPGGPYDLVASVTTWSYLDRDLLNGIPYYYIVSAVLPGKVPFSSTQVSAVPRGNLAPLRPARLELQMGLDTNSVSAVFCCWPPCDGAVRYSLQWVDHLTNIYNGSDSSFLWPLAPFINSGAVTNGQLLRLKLTAFSCDNYPSLDTSASIQAYFQTNGSAGHVLLSIGDFEVQSGRRTLSVAGPTNLLLRASVRAEDATDSRIYFIDTCDGEERIIGSGSAPVAEVTWFQVTQGNHSLIARAMSEAPRNAMGMISGGGAVYDSLSCLITVKLVPELATYQTSSTDLQLPAPGLPISVSRAYNSRDTNAASCLGRGWTASWESSLHISTNLHLGWVEAAISPWDLGCYHIADTNSHVVTVSLPGGGSESFSAKLFATGWISPVCQLGSICLEFAPFDSAQGSLACSGNGDTRNLDVKPMNGDEWNGDGLTLISYDNESEYANFVPDSFEYTATDGTRYIFQMTNALNGKLTRVIDRNGNAVTYQYSDTLSSTVTNLLHSNGRQVQLSYLTNTSDVWIHVYDSAYRMAAGISPVTKYLVHDQFLTEVHKLVDRASSAYETNSYVYGTANDDLARLTAIYDARGVRVLTNSYGHSATGAPDGRLVAQADALNHVTTLALDANDTTLTATNTVGGQTESLTVNHTAAGAISSVQNGYLAVTNDFDARGRLTQQIDALGNRKSIRYDDNDRPISQSDPLGNTTSTEYESGVWNQPGSTTDAKGATTTFEYGLNGNLTISTDPIETRTETTYIESIISGSCSAKGLLDTEVQSALDVPYRIATHYTYYTNANLTSNYLGELRCTIHQAETPSGSPLPGEISVTNLFEYDANGNRTKETRFATVNGVPGVAVVTSYFYDSQSRLIRTIDPLGRTNSITYKKNGKQATTTDVLGRTTAYTYDALGNLIETLYPDGTVSRTTYDEKSRVVFTQQRAILTTNGTVTLTTAPASLNVYDSMGRVIRVERHADVVLLMTNCPVVTLPGGGESQFQVVAANAGTLVSATRTVYDSVGQVQFSVDARGAITEYRYDAAGRRTNTLVYLELTANPTNTAAIVITSGAANASTSVEYDPNGNQVATTDALNRRTVYLYDEMNRQVGILFPAVDTNAPSTRSTHYDGLGRRTRETDEAGISTAFEYDFRGLLRSVTLDAHNTNAAARNVTQYTYDQAGSQESQIDALGRTTRFEFDLLGRRSKRTLPEGQSETFAYDDVGNLLFHTNFNGLVITNQYDIANRLTNRSAPFGYEVRYAYDMLGLRTNMIDPSGSTRYLYNTLHQLEQKTVSWANGPTASLNYRYDHTGALTNLWSSTGNGVNLRYAYDTLGRLTNVISGGALAAAYGFDLVGNLQTVRYGNSVTNLYQHDARNRLTNLVSRLNNSPRATFAYQVGPTGQRTALLSAVNYQPSPINQTNTWTYDRLSRLTHELIDGTSSATATYDLDAVGNRTTRSSTPLDYQSFGYNSNDWLTIDTYDPNGNTTVSSTNTYQYDPLDHLTNVNNGDIILTYDGDGNRVKKKVGATYRYYLVDDQNPTGYAQVLEEVDEADNQVVYTYGMALISQNRNSVLSYYGHDGQGSTRYLTDTSGTITDTYTYDAFGILLAQTGTTPTPYLYTGQQWDADLGMYYLRARYYQPNNGRFWTMDLREGMNDPQSLHQYLYCQHNPANSDDPSGLSRRISVTTGYVATGSGQHLVPFCLWDEIGFDEDAMQYLDQACIPALDHDYTKHPRYTHEVRVEWERFLASPSGKKSRNHGPGDVFGKEVAREFLGHVLTAGNPYIDGFNEAVRRGPVYVQKWFERVGRHIPISPLKTTFFKCSANRLGKRIPYLTFIIGAATYSTALESARAAHDTEAAAQLEALVEVFNPIPLSQQDIRDMEAYGKRKIEARTRKYEIDRFPGLLD